MIDIMVTPKSKQVSSMNFLPVLNLSDASMEAIALLCSC